MENQTIQTPMQGEIPNQPFRRFPVLSRVLIFIALLLLSFTVFLAYQNMQLQKQIVSLQPTPSPTYMEEGNENLVISPTSTTPKINQEVKSSVLQTFIDSLGKTKYVLYKIADDDASYSYNIYLSSQSSLSNEAIKLFTGVQNIDGVPFVTSNKDNVSSQSGKKYLIFDHMAGTTEFWLFDENGNNIKVDLSKMGLGTTIPGMYGLKFGAWIPNTTKFKIIALSSNDKTYEATFDAITGFQIGDTIEIGN
ncbi:MAG: hypothetical protein AAB569_07085 [Patescibacteria group bacterium]